MKYSSKQQATKRMFRLLLLVLLSVALVAGVYAVQKSQELRSKAAGGGGPRTGDKCEAGIGISTNLYCFSGPPSLYGCAPSSNALVCKQQPRMSSATWDCASSPLCPSSVGVYKGNSCGSNGAISCSTDPSKVGCPSAMNSLLCSANLWSCSNQPSCVSGGGGGGGGGGVSPGAPDLIQQPPCVAQCIPPGTEGVANPTNCGQFGKDPAQGACTTPGALCCKDRAEHRPPPEVKQTGITVSNNTLILGGISRMLRIKPLVNGGYSTLKVDIEQQQYLSALSKFIKQQPDGKLRLGFTAVGASTTGTKYPKWVATCTDTNPSPTANSCDGYTFHVAVWGLISGGQEAVVKVSASNENGTGIKTGSAVFRVVTPTPTPTP